MTRYALHWIIILPLLFFFREGKAQMTIVYPSSGEREFFSMPPLPVTASAAGKVITELGTIVPAVTISLTGSSSGAAVTSVTGQYHFDLNPEGNYAITPSKNNDILVTNGISTIDLLLVRQHVLATFPLTSPYKIIAADVDGSGAVGTLDFLLIRTVVLQINTTFPNGRLWTFVNSDFAFADPRVPFPYESARSYSNIIQDFQNQDFIGIKLGDVNNSWDPATPKQGAIGNMQLAMDAYTSMPGDEIIIPVRVKDFKNISGYQFTLSWDAEVLSLLEVNNKALQGYYGEQRRSEGWLTTTWYSETTEPVSLDDETVAFELKFLVAGKTGSHSEIKIGSELSASEAYNENLDLLEIKSRSGIINVTDDGIINHQPPIINLQVFPNPFKETATISFSLPEEQAADILIYDIEGKLVKESHEYYSSGTRQIQWDGKNSIGERLSTGCYFIKVNMGNVTSVAKVVRVE